MKLRVSTALAACLVLGGASEARALPGSFLSRGDSHASSDATRIVLFRDGNHTSITFQSRYRGVAGPFGIAVPLDGDVAAATVHTLDPSLLEHLDALSAPRVVDAWERNPCDRALFEGIGLGSLGLNPGGVGGNIDRLDHGLHVDGAFAPAAYQVSIVRANDATGWLADAGFEVVDGGAASFLFARGDASKLSFVDGATVLPPLRYDFESPTLSVPLHLVPLDGAGVEDVIVYVIAPQRYEAATMPNAFAPTNLELPPDAWSHVDEAYESLFVHALADHPGAAVTEYAGSYSSCKTCATMRVARELAGPLNAVDLATLGGDTAPSFAGRLAPSPTARVHEVALTLTGALARGDVEPIVAENTGRFRLCYREALRSDPTVKGRIALAWTIGRDGLVSDASVAESSITNATLSACLARQANSLSFPRKPSTTKVLYGLQLGPEPSTEILYKAANWVLTRLHLRLTKSAPLADLELRPADGVVGGNGEAADGGTLDSRVAPSPFSAYQARYLIHHPWTAEPSCKDPRPGHWIGRTFLGEESDAPGVAVATIAAFAARASAPPPPSADDGGIADAAVTPPTSPTKSTGCGACALGATTDVDATGVATFGLVAALCAARLASRKLRESKSTTSALRPSSRRGDG